MQYKLSNKVEKTTKTGKPYISATLTDEQGKEYTGVNAFNGEFAAEMWHGELEQNGQYWNLIIPKKASSWAYNALQTEKKQEIIEKSVNKAQENKEHGIRTASSMNKAVDLAIAEYANPKSLYTLEELIEKWRQWIWMHWEDTDKYPPFE